MAEQKPKMDMADYSMNALTLRDKYQDAGHPIFTFPEWLEIEEATGLAYWDWVVDCISRDKEDFPTIPIDDMPHFVSLLTQWHTAKVEVMQCLLEMPPGTEVIVDDGKPQVITGEMLNGFRVGLLTSLHLVGKLPFVAEMEDHSDSTKH